MSGKKILVADDSLTIQKVIRLALANEGYEIQTVSDGNDAVIQISLFRPDVVLIDIALPVKSAFEVKRETNQIEDLGEVRFVLLSSAFEKVDEEQATEVEFHGRLTKPFDPAHLRQILTEVLAQVTEKRLEKTSLLNSPFHPDDRPPLPPADELPPGFPPEFGISEFPMDGPLAPLPDFVEVAGPINPPPSPSGSPLDALWESAPPSPLPPDSSSSSEGFHSEEIEIRNLTESTVRMTGLDDFQWNVDEPAMKPLPPVIDKMTDKMTDKTMDIGATAFMLEPPPAPGTSFDMPEFKPENAESVEFPRDQFAAPAATPAAAPATTPARPDQGFDSNQSFDMDTLVQKQVEKALAKMTEKLLPELAEKIIKQEIHRLLND